MQPEFAKKFIFIDPYGEKSVEKTFGKAEICLSSAFFLVGTGYISVFRIEQNAALMNFIGYLGNRYVDKLSRIIRANGKSALYSVYAVKHKVTTLHNLR